MWEQLKRLAELGMLSVRNPKLTIHNLRLFCKNKYQRMVRGWSDYDAYNFNNWFLSVVPDMLKHMKENLHSTPISTELDEWEDTLGKMETCFRNADIDNVDMNEVPDGDIGTYCQNNLDEGMELLTVWFWELWD